MNATTRQWIGLTSSLAGVLLGPAVGAEEPAPKPRPTTAEVLAGAAPDEWRPLDPNHTLYLELDRGRVVIELSPELAPRHVANVETLVRQGYFDGLAIVRSQDNYVVQWGDPVEEEGQRRSLGKAATSLAPEWELPVDDRVAFTPLGDVDVYAPLVGFSAERPVARDPVRGTAWAAHCYGMVGAGRGMAADSGNGAELYVVIGHAPRHLDRNVTLVGRVVSGMELLSTQPRGTGPLGFYDDPEDSVPIRSVRLAADVPVPERTDLELLRTDSSSFAALIEARRYRTEAWFLDPVGAVELCNVPLPVRARETRAPAAGDDESAAPDLPEG